MKTRRIFIQTAGKVGLLSSLPILNLKLSDDRGVEKGNPPPKKIKIGIIGAENSHTVGFGKLFNIEKQFPGVEVTHVWGETMEFAQKAAKEGGIPNIVNDPEEMMGKIDALIVDHRHPKYHLKAAEPFVKAGIPTFIDKPFCYRVPEGKAFLKLAKESGTPITSYSTIAHSYETFSIREQVRSMKKINHVIMTGPVDLESKYGNVFFYGVHMVEPLLYIFGEDVQTVRVTRSGENATASLIYGNGMLVTFIFKTQSRGWETWVENEDGLTELKATIEDKTPSKSYVDLVKMFQTGEEPRSYESILKGIAILESLEKSSANGEWVKIDV